MSADILTIMVSGSQDYRDDERILRTLEHISGQHEGRHVRIVCGEHDRVLPHVEALTADYGWELQKLAGHEQCDYSQQCFVHMLEKKPDMMIAFSRKGCAAIWSHIREARGAGIPLRIYGQGR